MKKPVCIYVDDSNIYIGAQTVAAQHHEDPHAMRLAFDHFLYLITKGSLEFDELVWGGSMPPETEGVWDSIRKQGIEPELIPRKEGGEYNTVDQAIQLMMYRHARKYRDAPGTIVLCTGDGAGYHHEKGFLYDVTGFIEDGWDIVLYSWDIICHKQLKQFAREHGEYVKLEDYYKSVTFIKHGRHAEPVKFRKPRKKKLPSDAHVPGGQ